MKSMTFTQQKGLTLIELMIAVALGLLLAAGALMMFMGNKETALFQEQFARVQENGRFATDVIVREIRPTGFWGCGSKTAVVTNTLTVGSGIDPLDFSRPVIGFEAKGVQPDGSAATASDWESNADGGAVSSTIAAQAVKGTDILLLKTVVGSDCRILSHVGELTSKSTAGTCGCSRIACKGVNAKTMQFSEQCGLVNNDIVMVSNCVNAAIFQLSNVSTSSGISTETHTSGSSTGNCTTQLGQTYAGGSVQEIESYIYMIRDNASGIPSLYRYRNGTAEELVEGVEDMQVRYGEDTNGDGIIDITSTLAAYDGYVPAHLVTDWNNIYSIRIDLVIRSFNGNVLDTAQTILIDKNGDGDTADTAYEETVDTSDLRIRQVFTTTIAVRNKAT